MNEITQDQQVQLNDWASQRDAILLEISKLKTEQEGLIKQNKDIAVSNVDIEDRIQQSIGRVDELEKAEMLYATRLNSDVSNLESKKTVLETQITNLSNDVASLVNQKESLISDIKDLTGILSSLKDRAGALEAIIGDVTTQNNVNLVAISQLFDEIKTSSQEIIDVNQQNVTATNLVLDKLPAMLVELQRVKLIRNKI